jgi:protein involved in polysaccharide export with SLBB domain
MITRNSLLLVLVIGIVDLTGVSLRAQSAGNSADDAFSDCSLALGGDALDCASTGSAQSLSQPAGASSLGLGSVALGVGNVSTPSRANAAVYHDNAGQTTDPRRDGKARSASAKQQTLTEFQILIAGSLGYIVPIYGADLFTGVPETFAPVERIPVGPEYVIGPGDEILIRTWGQISQNLQLTVDRSGSIFIPQIGELHVAGLPFAQLQSFLKSHFAYVFKNFDLNVNLGQLRSIQVFVTGAAQRPGSYTVSSLSTLVNAVFACGGPAATGSLRHVELRHGSSVVADFDLYDLLLRGDKSKDAPLQSGDVIYFPPVGPRVAVVGSVQLPAIYELRRNETIQDALAFAGGTSSVANTSSLQIERTQRQPGGSSSRVAMEVTMDSAGLALSLADADLIRVRARAPSFTKTVTLRGNVAEPGRFAWRPGMRIRDLIPDQQALLTHDYWLRREQLGLPAADFQPLLPAVTSNSAYAESASQTRVVPQNAQALSIGLFPQLTQGIPAETQSTASAHAQYAPIAASDDETTAENNSQATETPRTLGTGSRLVTAPHFPIQNQVVRTTPDIHWSYAVVERVDQKTFASRLIPFNLGAVVIDHDESADLDLEPGDVITIFSDADIRVPRAQQTKYVRLEGEFAHAGVYSLLAGETLRQLIKRAGGLTGQAYLYGSQFTRESTRLEQQQRLDEYVTALSVQIETVGSNMAASVATPQQAALANASGASQRGLVSRLRQMRATGRIVLHINPVHSTFESLPDLPLEDGDRFVVPPIPSTVNVVGAVYDPNSFVYLAHRDAGSYLKSSGGPTRNADRRRMFIIRADGSVVSRQGLSGTLWEGDSFERLTIYPGDTIVVPAAMNKATFLRGLTDWSSVFSQFALGAGAIQILKP